jgi:hypothetical protein
LKCLKAGGIAIVDMHRPICGNDGRRRSSTEGIYGNEP